MPTRILNIAGGKQLPLHLEREDPYFLLNLDRMYYLAPSPEECESYYKTWMNQQNQSRHYCINEDIKTFLERTTMKFDLVTIYRYLEHVARRDILFFIYLVSTVIEKHCIVDIIVPDYHELASMILKESVMDEHFEAHDILVTSELLNEPEDPHQSIWTVARVKHFWELEGRFTVDDIERNFPFDGRDIYLRALVRRL